MSRDVGVEAALDRLLGGADLAWLLDRVRRRILAAPGEPLTGVVALTRPTPEQREAVVRLVGPPKRTAMSTLRVDLAVVEEMLRRGPWPAGLADAVETLTGPVVDRSAERTREDAAWEAARALLADTTARFPDLGAWWQSWCASGGLKRATRSEALRTGQPFGPAVATTLVGQAAAVLEALPSAAEPLSVLARRIVGDAHGLDDARPLGRLTAGIAAVAFARDRDVSVRDAWAAAGVVLSNVASTVLCLGVPGTGLPADSAPSLRGSATAAALTAMRMARMPVVLTLDQVRSGGVAALPVGAVVHVCENPTVVEVVADRWSKMPVSGSVDVVLVCTSGQPSTAVVELLHILVAAGAECRYHGDFDWPGLRIALSLGQRVRWSPWRFSAADYRAALADGTHARRLAGSAAGSPWDPELAVAMAAGGEAVEEEAMAAMLADDVLAPRMRA